MGSKMQLIVMRLYAPLLLILATLATIAEARELARGRVHDVLEIRFAGPEFGPQDAPVRNVELSAEFRHESGSPQYKVHGFWDGDGQGGARGGQFRVRFCPTREGRWDLAAVSSNVRELNGQQQGDHITVAASDHPGFWIVDDDSSGRRWYKRTDGSHPYIIGNTHYSFLSGYMRGEVPSQNDIEADIVANSRYFKKLRFGISGDLYPNPRHKPFFNDAGQPTDVGDHSHRPNPEWFHQRVDVAVRAAYEHDLIADVILAGPDSEASRSTLRSRYNGGDPTPFLRYMAARYGSFPNVWFCLCNEYEIRTPTYTEQELARFGQVLRQYLPYPTTPISVHSTPRTLWSANFDKLPEWHDHHIIQKKLRQIAPAADVIRQVWENERGSGPRHRPTVNDELSYEGAGDEHSEHDTIESHLGAFLGGGYGTTGEKSGNKIGQYFAGGFDPDVHTAADNLKWLRDVIDEHITFWKMAPDMTIFENLDDGFRGMAWEGREYVLGTNKQHDGIAAKLPAGEWTVTKHDVIQKTSTVLSRRAHGDFRFNSPNSRAVLFHFKKNQ
jgi:hypothetical protein